MMHEREDQQAEHQAPDVPVLSLHTNKVAARRLSNQRMQALRPLLPLHVHVRLNIHMLELLHAYETTREASCFMHMQDVREYTYLSYL
jgi:hypothetical protein